MIPSSSETAGAITFRGAYAQLAVHQKPSKGAPAYSRYINRPLGRVFAAAAYTAGLNPTQVTLLSAACTFSGIALIAVLAPTWVLAVTICALLVAGYALDSADGQLARITGGGSLGGEWLDHTVDAVKTSAFHGAVLICWYRFYEPEPMFLLVPLGFMVVSAVMFFGFILADMMRRVSRGSGAMILTRDGSSSLLYSLAVIPMDYGLMCLFMLLLAWPPVFMTGYTLLFAANVLLLAAAQVRWYREMRSLAVRA